jgi:hypothetical protein
LPLFYFFEVVWPYNYFHPISVFLYGLCLSGLVFMVWRRCRTDRFVLLWFGVVYVFFTLVSNREWRYVVTLFPALAISAAVVVLSLGGALRKTWLSLCSVNKKRLAKVAAVMLTVLVAGAMFYSAYESYTVVLDHQVTIDIGGAVGYVTANIEPGRTVLVLCPVNFFNYDMVQFYLWAHGDHDTKVFQYPFLAVDAYTPDFDIVEVVGLCRENNVQYVLLFEFGDTNQYYFKTELTPQKAYEQLCLSGSFSEALAEQVFGDSPRQIFVITFTG